MGEIIFICVIQIILILSCLFKYISLIKFKGDRLYWHEKKSFTDILFCITMFMIFNIIVMPIVKGAMMFLDNHIKVGIMEYILIVFIILLLFALSGVTMALSIYMISEVKHLSPEDGIGIKIYEEKTMRSKAAKFYVNEFLLGLVISITMLFQIAIINKFIFLVFTIELIVIFSLGMADVLQHEDYNNKSYTDKYKRMNIEDKLYISNIVRLFKDASYRGKSIKMFKCNIHNIRLGIINIFKSMHTGLKSG